MNVLKSINNRIIYLGYLLIIIAVNGFFGIFIPSNNLGTPRWAWYLLAIIGGGIVGLKTLKFDKQDRLKMIAVDVLFTFILIFFALLSLPRGLNFLIGSVVGVLFLYYLIDKKLLQKLS